MFNSLWTVISLASPCDGIVPQLLLRHLNTSLGLYKLDQVSLNH